MGSHSTKNKSRAPSKKRALLRVGSFVVSTAIALSPGAVPAMTALRAMADKGELITLDTKTYYDSTDREGLYIENLFYDNVDDGTSGESLEEDQPEAYEAYLLLKDAVKDLADGKMTDTEIRNVLTREITATEEPVSSSSSTETTETAEPTEEPTTEPETSEEPDTTESPDTSETEPTEPDPSDNTDTETVDVTKLAPAEDAMPALDHTVPETVTAEMETDITAALVCLFEDVPADLYWLNFDSENRCSLEYTYDGTTVSYSVKFIVSPDYRADGNLHIIDSSIMGRARSAAKLAKKLIDDNTESSASDRAAAYCKGIYDIPAVEGAAVYTDAPTIDPKVLAKVFSGESGSPADRANAFQYLCNMDNGFSCITVSGLKNSIEYVWNVVTIGGENYLVDITDYDSLKTVTENRINGFTLDNNTYGYSPETADFFGDKLILKTDDEDDPGTSSSTTSSSTSSDPTSSDPTSSGSSSSDPTVSDPVHEHTWSTGWERDKDYHWHYCIDPDCDGKNNRNDLEAHIPGAEATATESQTCTVCGYVIAPATGHKHTWSEWKSDYNGHWRECLDPDCGEISEKLPHGHKFERIVKIEATCQHSGTWEDVEWCPDCHWIFSRTDVTGEIIPPIPHDYEILKSAEVKPTCETDGSITESKKCKVCGHESEEKKIIPKLGHKPSSVWYANETEHWRICENCNEKTYNRGSHSVDNGVITKPATETEPGIRTYSCTVCAYNIKTEEIKALGANHKHNYNVLKSNDSMHWFECACGEIDQSSRTKHKGVEKEEIITEATCGETGLKEVVTYCSEKKCNRELDRELKVIPKTNKHTFDKGVCKVCGEKDDDYVEPHTHTASAAWYGDSINHWHTCTVVNCKELLDKGVHNSDAGNITYPATATMAGLKTYSCTVCGRTLRTEIIPATGNSSGSSTTDPLNPSNPSNPTNPSNPGGSNISQSTQSGANAPRAQIRSSDNTLFNALLTAYERERVQNGESMAVRLTVDNADNSAPDSDRAAVERLVSTLSNYKVGQYLDVNLYKTVGSERKQILASINDLTITFDIPESIRGKSSYAMVRIHDGAAALLQDKDNDPNTITIDTSLFSTYAIVYRDQASGYNPPTGVAESPYIVSTIIGASAFIVFNVVISVVGKKKRKSNG
ncbi:MAG: hypothetical protein K2N38_00445 [Oscillospiraceae bacterium]|nr:hypothetical protein [Oscillospiraceae bacterium]